MESDKIFYNIQIDEYFFNFEPKYIKRSDMTPGFKTILNYGAYIGLADFIVFLLLYMTGYNPLGPASWFGAWIPILFMYRGTVHFRDYIGDGYMTYWRAFMTAVIIAGAGAFLFDIIIYSFGNLIDGSFVDLQLRDMNESMLKLEEKRSMISESMYQKLMNGFEKSKKDLNVSTITFADFQTKLLGAIIVSFFTAFFLRKKKSIFDNASNENDEQA